MKTTYDERLSTFESWPHSQPSPPDMAAAGFSSTGDGDIVVCGQCDISLISWVEEDVPLQEHILRNPDCPFLLEKQEPSSNTTASDPNALNLIQPTDHNNSSSAGTTYNQRLATFISWPHSSPTRENMAAAGFSQRLMPDSRDLVECVDCFVTLVNWKDYDDPWKYHGPKCSFISKSRNPEILLNGQPSVNEATQNGLPNLPASAPAPVPMSAPALALASPLVAPLTAAPVTESNISAANSNISDWIAKTMLELPDSITQTPISPVLCSENQEFIDRWNKVDSSFGDPYSASFVDKGIIARLLVCIISKSFAFNS